MELRDVQEKLAQAKLRDPDLEVFGADYHAYELGPPISLAAVRTFEQQYGITLPEDFVTFITTIGNGGPGDFGGADAGH